MFRRIFTIWLVAFLAVSLFSTAGFSKGERHKVPNIGPEALDAFDARVDAMIEAGFQLKQPVPHHNSSYGPGVTPINSDTLGLTTYDLLTNEIVEDQIALGLGGAFDGSHQVFMKRVPTASDPRFATYGFYSRLIGDYLGEFVPTTHTGSGWPRVTDGPNHEGVYTYHWSSGGLQTHLRIDDGEGFLTFGTDITVDPAGLWPGNDWVGGTLVVSTTDDPAREPGRTYVSTDGGASFAEIGYPGQAIPGATGFTNAETGPAVNPANPNQIGLINIEDSGGPDFGGYTWSTSTGITPPTTWNQTVIYAFNSMLPDNSFYNSWASGNNLTTHASATYSADGTAHVVFNASGWQLDAAGDTLYPIHTVAYWNSSTGQVIEVSDPAVSRSPLLGDSITAYYPGRGLGMGYPDVSVGPNGQVLVAWEQPELEPDSSNLHYVFGTLGAQQVKFFATNIFGNLSYDNGVTWTGPFKMGGEDDQMDIFPQLADLEETPGGLHAHFLYFYDSNPGGSVSPGETDPSTCAWIYNEVLLPAPIVGIDDGDGNVVDRFELQQNYPNPFNPSTTIAFSLNKATKVTLAVYNVLGEKVATLVNGVQQAGAHSVQFDASKYTSGIYFYTLSANNVKQTRKMVLMK